MFICNLTCIYTSAGCTAPVNNATCPGLPGVTCEVVNLDDCNVTLLLDEEDVMDELEGKTHCDVVNEWHSYDAPAVWGCVQCVT